MAISSCQSIREALRREVIAQLDQLLSTLTDAETGQRGFIITGDERYLQPYNDAVKRYRTRLVRLLEIRGYDIRSVPSVATGLRALDHDEFDLLLCDLGLPDGTGMDFIEKVRKTRQTPAIALTGFGMRQDVERAQQAGFDAHLTKPVNLQKLEAAIWKLLQDRQ